MDEKVLSENSFKAARNFLAYRGYEEAGDARLDNGTRVVIFVDGHYLTFAPVVWSVGAAGGYPPEPEGEETHKALEALAHSWVSAHAEYSSFSLRIDTISLVIIAPKYAELKHHRGVYYPPESVDYVEA